MTANQARLADYLLKIMTPLTLALASWAFTNFASRLEKVESKLSEIQVYVATIESKINICALRIDALTREIYP